MKKKFFLLGLLGAIALVFLLAGCTQNLPPDYGKTEIFFEPIQCQQNPWEKWYAEGNINFFKAPTEKELLTAGLALERHLGVGDNTPSD